MCQPMELNRSLDGEYLMYFDLEANKHVYLMEVDGKLCPYYFHDSKISHQYTAYNAIKKDLDIAREAFKELYINRGQSLTIRLSLLFAGIMLYGKCYSEAKGRRVKLNYKTISIEPDDKFSVIHKHLINLRNQYVAHAGEGDYEQYPLSLNLNPDIGNKKILGYMINGIQQVHHEPFLKDYIMLIDKVIEYVSRSIHKVELKLNTELSKLDIEEIYSSAKTPIKEHSAPISGVVKLPKNRN